MYVCTSVHRLCGVGVHSVLSLSLCEYIHTCITYVYCVCVCVHCLSVKQIHLRTYFPLLSIPVQASNNAAFDFLAQSFHSAPLSGMDVCLRKPLVATCSLDRTVRVWNYENQ